jgi:hypothetical protein
MGDGGFYPFHWGSAIIATGKGTFVNVYARYSTRSFMELEVLNLHVLSTSSSCVCLMNTSHCFLGYRWSFLLAQTTSFIKFLAPTADWLPCGWLFAIPCSKTTLHDSNGICFCKFNHAESLLHLTGGHTARLTSRALMWCWRHEDNRKAEVVNLRTFSIKQY